MNPFRAEAEYLKIYVPLMTVDTIEAELKAFVEIMRNRDKQNHFPTDHVPHTNC